MFCSHCEWNEHQAQPTIPWVALSRSNARFLWFVHLCECQLFWIIIIIIIITIIIIIIVIIFIIIIIIIICCCCCYCCCEF